MEMLRRQAKWYALAAFGSLLCANILIWQAVFAETRNGVLTVAFLDVGQGDAIFIEAPSGTQVLIDGGPSRAVLRELGAVMPYYDSSIDVVVATHPDADHIGGLSGVLERYDVAYVLEPGVSNSTGAYRAFEGALAGSRAERVRARRGMVVSLGRGVSLRILFPDRDVSRVSDTNDASIVAQLVYGDTKALLTGDAPQKIERYLVSLDGHALESDILKAGHHGSKTSSSEVFVGFVSPAYVIISAGADNRYGHPHQEVLDTLARFGITPFSTAESGTLTLTSDGARWRRK